MVLTTLARAASTPSAGAAMHHGGAARSRSCETAHSGGQREPEGAAAARRGLDPDAPAVQLDDLAADREAEAVARRRLRGVRAGEEIEDPFAVALADAGTVVAHGQRPFAGAAGGEHLDDR